jgi:glucose-6-phosphate isomerase
VIKIDIKNAGITKGDVDFAKLHKKLHDTSAENNNVWVKLPSIITDADIAKIQKTAKEIRMNFDVLFVVGTGGSYAGAYAGLNWFDTDFPVVFLGTSFDPTLVDKAIKKWRGKRICANVISKSGTTLEITSTVEAIKPFVKRTIITMGEKYKEEFAILNGVGGRFSVLSSVGYLPMAVAGIDIKKMHEGARAAYKDLENRFDNEAYKYAMARHKLHNEKKKTVEILASFYEGLEGMGRWWQQLFGESEGKEGKGLMPVPLTYSRDLHSMGQYVQQGNQIFFETILNIENPPIQSKYNKAAFIGTVKAHADAGVPVIILNIDRLDEYGFGYLFYFFEIACAMSAFLLGVNPFDQPGVEFYKKEMRVVLNA